MGLLNVNRFFLIFIADSVLRIPNGAATFGPLLSWIQKIFSKKSFNILGIKYSF